MESKVNSKELKIRRVQNSTNPNLEGVYIEVKLDCNLNRYAIVDQMYAKDPDEADGIDMSNIFRHIYFFPFMEVNKEDWIVLHTGNGTNRTYITKSNVTIHRLYWKSRKCVWNDKEGDNAYLLSLNVIQIEPVTPESSTPVDTEV